MMQLLVVFAKESDDGSGIDDAESTMNHKAMCG
jgi:hypothetical protein